MGLFIFDPQTPEKVIPNPSYPSGAYEEEQGIYMYALPSSKFPVVRIPYIITDSTGEFGLKPGFYEVAISNNRNYLLLIQSKIIKAKIPIIKISYKKQVNDLDDASKSEKIKKKKTIKQSRNSEKEMNELREQAKLKAEIIDSREGYFILKYDDSSAHAEGYLPY